MSTPGPGLSRRHFVERGEARLAVGDRGEGPPVVLLPAGGRSAADYAALEGELAAAGFRALAVDPRGTGESTGPLAGLTLHDLAADVAAVIEALCREPAHVVGHAIGQRVVRCLACDRPELVRSVTALATGGAVAPAEDVMRHLALSFRLELGWEDRLPSLRAAWFAPGSDPEVWRGGWYPDQFFAFAAAVMATAKEEWWAAGVAPMLAIQGLADRVAPPENGRALARELGARVRIIDLDRAGHALLPERPEAIAKHLIAFLREVEAAPPKP